MKNMSDQIQDSRTKAEYRDSRELFEHEKLIHDLRNCLSPILMQAQILSLHAATSGTEREAIKKSANVIERKVQEMVKLLDQKLL